jgi:Fe-S-cluster containining protein
VVKPYSSLSRYAGRGGKSYSSQCARFPANAPLRRIISHVNDAVAQYRALRDRIDRESGLLVDLHCKHLACKAGCHDCCTDLTVSPVEYESIRRELADAGATRENVAGDPGAACAFLRGGLCGLYRARPLICRTHGLPVAFVSDDDHDAPAMSVSFCPKNFTDADEDDLDFGPENTLDLERLNVDLADVDARFGASPRPAEPAPRRVPLRQLLADLPAGA